MNYTGNINIVMYDGEHENIKQYMENVTGGRKYNVIPIKTDLSHVYAIGEALQNQEIICMHADRFVGGGRTALVPFLGEDAQFPIGPFQLIKTFRAPYTFVYGVKTGWTKYNFFARPFRQATSESKIKDMVKDYATDLEGMVKQYPEQWFNYYDFWKKTK
jgi:predicted LPLAT superfamily acyltransferase